MRFILSGTGGEDLRDVAAEPCAELGPERSVIDGDRGGGGGPLAPVGSPRELRLSVLLDRLRPLILESRCCIISLKGGDRGRSNRFRGGELFRSLFGARGALMVEGEGSRPRFKPGLRFLSNGGGDRDLLLNLGGLSRPGDGRLRGERGLFPKLGPLSRPLNGGLLERGLKLSGERLRGLGLLGGAHVSAEGLIGDRLRGGERNDRLSGRGERRKLRSRGR